MRWMSLWRVEVWTTDSERVRTTEENVVGRRTATAAVEILNATDNV